MIKSRLLSYACCLAVLLSLCITGVRVDAISSAGSPPTVAKRFVFPTKIEINGSGNLTPQIRNLDIYEQELGHLYWGESGHLYQIST